MKKYRVTLTAAERDELERLLARGKGFHPAWAALRDGRRRGRY